MTDDLTRLRLENHRLSELVKAADEVIAEVRAGLKEALEAIDAHDHCRGVCDDNVMSDQAMSDLRKLLGGES